MVENVATGLVNLFDPFPVRVISLIERILIILIPGKPPDGSEALHLRKDYRSSQGARARNGGNRSGSRARHLRAKFLPLEEQIGWHGSGQNQVFKETRGGKFQAEEAARRGSVRQGYFDRCRSKKVLRPAACKVMI